MTQITRKTIIKRVAIDLFISRLLLKTLDSCIASKES